MTPQRVTLITLGVSELGVSRRFYEALGWQAHRETQDSIVFFQLNTMALGLFGRVALAEDQGRPTAQLGTGAMTLAINYGDQDEVDQAFNDALNAGTTLLKRPQKVFWGGYSGYYGDPDGHVWEIAYNPFWPLDEDGGLVLPSPKISG